MKKYIHLSYLVVTGLFVLSLLSISCKRSLDNQQFNAILNNVEPFVNNYPDSAKKILMPYFDIASNVNGCANMCGTVTEEQRARYCLLMNTAIYKTNCLESDSLINIAADYYLNSKDHKYYKALTYLNLGFANFVLNKYDKAVSNYYSALNTIHLIKHTDSDKLNFLYFSIYSNLGIIYYNQGIDNDAIIMYRQAFKYASLLKDTYRMSMQLSSIASTYYDLKQYDSTIYYCDKAQKLFQQSDKNISYYTLGYRHILFIKSLSYLARGENDSTFFNLIIANNLSSKDKNYQNDLEAESIIRTLGELFLLKNEVDSAKYYFKSLLRSEHAGVKWQANMKMYEIAKDIDHNNDSALFYYEKAINNKVQCDDEFKLFETQQIRNNYEFQKEKAVVEAKNMTHMWSAIAIFSVFIIIVLMGYLILNHHIQHEKSENEKLRNELKIKEHHINSLVNDLENMTVQFEKTISNTEIQTIALSESEKKNSRSINTVKSSL